jgi:hypothetical protein
MGSGYIGEAQQYLGLNSRIVPAMAPARSVIAIKLMTPFFVLGGPRGTRHKKLQNLDSIQLQGEPTGI